ncbi:MAG: tRNA dihydrouridine synthase [Campylobacterota bacterium]
MIEFDKPLYFLAPLAGYTDLPFRSVVKQFGADVTMSEMISANALAFQNKKTLKMLEKSPLENPYSIQIAGNDTYHIQKAVEYINTLGGVDDINLNCGCPAPKVANNGSGSGLLQDLEKMGKIIKTIKDYANTPTISVKVRIGYVDKKPLDIAKTCQDNGADFIAVHGRTKAGAYKAPVDYDAIAGIKKALSIPVIANGDITDAQKAQWVFEHTGCDGVMIGRGAIGKPWIFHQMKNNTDNLDKAVKKAVILEHFKQMIRFYDSYGAIMFRKHLHTYSKGYEGASQFRETINQETDTSKIELLITEFF